ncbi:MAG: zinc ribbon domain-containing protein, partial [Acidobacteria bacterium]|nr:zinc ribbon domain-containing protein [Acidobacteriota bacterium]
QPPPLTTLRTDIPADVERVIMRSLAMQASDRHSSVAEWIEDLETAAEDVSESRRAGASRLIVMASAGAEVYIDDERAASVGRSGRVVLTDIPVGQHILRVAKAGERDDERVIEVRAGAGEQVIQALLKPFRDSGSQPSSTHGRSSGASSLIPGIVVCTTCHSRFAEGVKFCGRCGGPSFVLVSTGEQSPASLCPRCSVALPRNSKFCGRCGLNAAELFTTAPHDLPPQAERVCRRCGSAFPPHIRFCGKCGSSLV